MKKLLIILVLFTQLFASGPFRYSDGSESWFYSNRYEGITISPNGLVGIGMTTPSYMLDVAGTINANCFVGDGSGLTGITVTSLPDTVVTSSYTYAVTLNNTDNIFYGTLIGTANYATSANNSTSLNGEDASYYLDASNINAGTLDVAYMDSEVVTNSYSSAVTLSSANNLFYGDGSNLVGVVATSFVVTLNIVIDPVYLHATRTPGVGQLSTSGMEYLSFDSGSSQNIKFQTEVPSYIDSTISPNLIITYTTSDNANSTTISYTVGYNIVGEGEDLNAAFTTITGTFAPTGDSGIKFIDRVELAPVVGNDSLQVYFERNDDDGYDDAMWTLNYAIEYRTE